MGDLLGADDALVEKNALYRPGGHPKSPSDGHFKIPQ
jgi:hypothetical protein